MRLAIFGGSFDPPHVGHLLAVADAREQLALDRVVLVPAATQPLKQRAAQTPAAHRLAMVRLLVADEPGFEVSTVELDRGGVSFTVDTLAHFAEAYPDAERFQLLGSDVLHTFGQWKDRTRVVELARPVLLRRTADPPAAVPEGLERAEVLPTRRVDVSSTEIRERVRQGKSIRGFVTDAVAAYIAREGLYR